MKADEDENVAIQRRIKAYNEFLDKKSRIKKDLTRINQDKLMR